MGVPRLFPWIVSHFERGVKHIQATDKKQYVDNLYLDANGLLHVAAQVIYHYGQGKGLINRYEELNENQRLLACFEYFFESIKEVSSIVVPSKVLYIAIDGPAPLAKQYQQRQRRFVSAMENPCGSAFNTSSITPGTKFMFELTKYLNYAIRKEMNSGFLKNVKIIFSPPNVPGEGEHKIMNYMRRVNKTDESHCIFGPDGDLIMLTLAAHLPKMFLFREDQFNPGFYHFVDMGLVRQGLSIAFSHGRFLREKTRSFDDICNDFILAGFFVGNDFLPKIQMFLFLEEGLELMLRTYAKISSNGQNFLTSSNDVINFQGFTSFINELAKNEVKYLIAQASYIHQDEKFKDQTLLAHCKTNFMGEVIFDFPAYRLSYYKRAGIFSDLENKVRKMCLEYLKSINFVYLYYVTGLPSWSYCYSWHYAPLMADLSKVLTSMSKEDKAYVITFEPGEPSLPFVQLLSSLPPSAFYLLPSPFSYLMLNPKSRLVKLGYYPDKFDIDYEGKTKEHMAIAKLPFVDINIIREAYEPIAKKLKHKYERNTFGKDVFFKYESTYKATYQSMYGGIDNLKVKKRVLSG